MVFQSYFSCGVFYVRIRVLDIVSCLKFEKISLFLSSSTMAMAMTATAIYIPHMCWQPPTAAVHSLCSDFKTINYNGRGENVNSRSRPRDVFFPFRRPRDYTSYLSCISFSLAHSYCVDRLRFAPALLPSSSCFFIGTILPIISDNHYFN